MARKNSCYARSSHPYPWLLRSYTVTTHVVRLKLFRLKAEGAGRARLRRFAGETVGSCTKHGFKIRSIPVFPNSLQPIHLSSYVTL